MEHEKCEYKRSLVLQNEILESISAFANTFGGEIFVGIDDDGKVVGASIGKKTFENFASVVKREIDPQVNISIKATQIENKDVIVIAVPFSPLRPHFFKGIAFKRVGKANLKLSPAELEHMMISRTLSLHDVDSLPMKVSLGDISETLVKEYVSELGKKYSGIKHAIKSLGLGDDEAIAPSAVLFFGNNPAKFFPLFGVKCAVFKGNEMLAIRDFSKPIYENVEPVMAFIKQNIPFSIRFEGVKRIEEPRIPEEAMRESLMNALVHADYTLDSTIYVRITEDAIEIKNGGILPPSLSLPELLIPHISKPRNKKIASLAHGIGWIEHWGEGTLKIIRSMRERGLEAEFWERNGYFNVRLHGKEMELNERQKKILHALKESGTASSKSLAGLGIPERTLRSYLAFLAEKGFIKKIGKGRSTHYSF